jgi:hypothetical protein
MIGDWAASAPKQQILRERMMVMSWLARQHPQGTGFPPAELRWEILLDDHLPP